MPRRSVFTWNAVLGAADGLQSVKAVFERMPQWDAASATMLLNAYAQEGDVQGSLQVFMDRSLPSDAITWSSMLYALTQNGCLLPAEKVFHRMPMWSVASWTTMLDGCAQLKGLAAAESFFDEMPQTNTVTMNVMIRAYSDAGELEQSVELFQRMRTRSQVTWNVLMRAFAETGDLPRAREVYERMPAWSTRPCNTMVAAYGRFQNTGAAVGLFANVAYRDQSTWNAMIRAFAEAGYLHEAEATLQRMPHHSTLAWDAVMVAAVAVKSMFDQMPHRGIASWNIAVRAAGSSAAAAQVLAAMPMWSLVSWNSLLAASDAKQGLVAFQLMQLEGIKPNTATFTLVFQACASLAALREGRAMHGWFLEQERSWEAQPRDMAMMNSLLNLYGKCAEFDEAERIFVSMGPSRTMVSWNAMIEMYARHGRGQEAVTLLGNMFLEGLAPNASTLASILSMCSHAGRLADADAVLGWTAMVLSVEHYACLVDLLARVGQLGEAEELLLSVAPWSGVGWSSLLRASRSHGDAETGSRAAQRAWDFDPEGGAPYTLLSWDGRTS